MAPPWLALALAAVLVTLGVVVTRARRRVTLQHGTRAAPAAAPAAAPPRAVPILHEGRTPLHSVPTLRGDLVRSRAEARIANVLHRSGIAYDYEPIIAGFRPDFYVPAWDLVIEYWGLDTPEYNERRRVKTLAYLSEGHKLLSLEPRHWAALEDKLTRKLARFDQDVRDLAPTT